MDTRKLKTLLVFALTLMLAISVEAQANTLVLNTPAEGSLAPGESDTWTFTAQNSAVLSFALQSQTDGFDAAIVLTDSSGTRIISNDDYNYPDSFDPLLEAITMPRNDTFTLTVSGVNNTGGDYTLTMLPGYSVPAYSDDFSVSDWQPLSDILTAELTDEQLSLNISGARVTEAAFDNAADTFDDFYAQAQVTNVANASGWVAGLAFRHQDNSYYRVAISSDGTWRFLRVEDGVETVIRDWTPHPNIVPGAARFTLAVLARGVGFDFFYNTGYIGSASDSALTGAGKVGLVLGTISSQASTSSATFDDLIVTTPAETDAGYIIPQQLYGADPSALVQTLKRRHVVSAAGQMALTIPESSVQFARPGINRFMLGNGTRFGNFALGAVVTLSAGVRGPAGCGIVFRFASETDYTLAYFNQDGEFGVSERTGDTFSPGISGVNSPFSSGQHQMLIIANDDMLYYYLDGVLVGTLEETAQDGEIGIAVVNFEPNTTNCTYNNLWLWNWE